MSKDTIYREDAIKAIHREARLAGGSVAIEYADMFQGAIKAVPSADRPRAEWIEQIENFHGFWVGRCSRCGAISRVTNYCPNCGCQMKGADDED